MRFRARMFLRHLHNFAMDIRQHLRERLGKPISMSSSAQKITVTSLSMSVLVLVLRLVIRKTRRPSGTSSQTALRQVAHLQKDYMLSGRVVYL